MADDTVGYERLKMVMQEDEDTKKVQMEERNKDRIPRSAFFIMGNEGVERFSFYGMKAILAIYLTHFLHFDQNIATTTVHLFVSLCYSFPLFGAFLADSYLGRYKTILYLSAVYCCGNVVMSFSAVPGMMGTPPQPWGAFIGLLLIALGTGGIKPCVSSFVGDQFQPGQEHLLSSIFASFYFVINIGSLASTFITPLLREHLSYAVAFAVPAALLVFSTFIFWLGKTAYRYIPPGGENVLSTFTGVIGFAANERRRCLRAGSRKLPRWLDYALVLYPKETVDSVKRVLSVLKVFLPLPMFWALFDQHASRWIFQNECYMFLEFFLTLTPQKAEQLDLSLGPHFKLLPDQIPSLNPMLLLIFIPVYDRLVFPLLRRGGMPLKPLNRMAFGMVLSALAFCAAGVLQIFINAMGNGKVSIAWQIPQYILLCSGEILVSVTGLEFAYSQAPRNMKSVVMSCYLLTTAVGNLCIAIVALIRFHARATEFFFFSGMMIIFLLLFLAITRKYKYKSLQATEISITVPQNDDEDSDSSTDALITHSGVYFYDSEFFENDYNSMTINTDYNSMTINTDYNSMTINTDYNSMTISTDCNS